MPKLYPRNDATNKYQINEVIKKRWSPVAFSSEPIEPDKINSLFEAMRWAPSSRNEQPWRIIYATKGEPKDYERLASLLNEDNGYAKDAYFLGVICALKHHIYKNKPNRTYLYDTGAAAENLFLQAVSMGLAAHEMGGFDQEGVYEKLGIPEDEVYAVAMIAVGYPGDESKLSEELKKKQNKIRERKPIAEIAMRGKWRNSPYLDI